MRFEENVGVDRVLADPFVIFIVSERAICCADPREVGGVSMRACSRIALFKINSAGVTPLTAPWVVAR